MNRTYKRGTVWWIDLPLDRQSHVQGGCRPCVIISNHDPASHSGVITVCPLSTRIDSIPTHTMVHVKKPGQVLCEQIMTVDVRNVGDYCGIINTHDMELVDRTIMEYLGLVPNTNPLSENSMVNRLSAAESEIKRLAKMLDTAVVSGESVV